MNLYWRDAKTAPSEPRQKLLFLVLGGAVMVGAAWLVAPPAGPAIALMAALYGWVACWLTRGTGATPAAACTITPPPAANHEPDPSVVLRHDLRGILSPALMVSDRLLAHPDPAVARAGEVVARTVQRVTERLEATRAADPSSVPQVEPHGL